MARMMIDAESARIISAALQAAESLQKEVAACGDVHSSQAWFEIIFHYIGDEGEWFAVTEWENDWFEVVSGDERQRQLWDRS